MFVGVEGKETQQKKGLQQEGKKRTARRTLEIGETHMVGL